MPFPRESWPLARVLSVGLMKTGHTRPLVEPRRRPQAGKSGDPRSQNADRYVYYLGSGRFQLEQAKSRKECSRLSPC